MLRPLVDQIRQFADRPARPSWIGCGCSWSSSGRSTGASSSRRRFEMPSTSGSRDSPPATSASTRPSSCPSSRRRPARGDRLRLPHHPGLGVLPAEGPALAHQVVRGVDPAGMGAGHPGRRARSSAGCSGRWIRGQVLLGVTVGVATFLGLLFLGATVDPIFSRFAVLLAVIAGSSSCSRSSARSSRRSRRSSSPPLPASRPRARRSCSTSRSSRSRTTCSCRRSRAMPPTSIRAPSMFALVIGRRDRPVFLGAIARTCR